ncbi:MAG: FAD-binding oxidoreductase [Clostridia bacterium]|nr:FAD-binding oxidoreductase [Clostridia bacterium]
MKSRESIQSELAALVGGDRVITNEDVLRESSVDRYLKYQWIHNVYTRPLPAAVVKAASVGQVSRVLAWCSENGVNCVPRTGASATEGGLETIVPDSVVLDGSDMNALISIDTYNMQAAAQCGMPLERLENLLREQGCTTGHSPQSKPLAQLGGLVATRSIGQFSTLYGGIEDMVAGLEAVLPDGEIVRIKSVPRRAAGPDIRHILIGSEGSLGFITEVTLKIHRYMPENNRYYGFLLDDMETGVAVLRDVMVGGYRPSVARLYDVQDGDYHFSHFETGRCVLIFVAEGPKEIAEATGRAIETLALARGAQPVERAHIERWFLNLNWGPKQIAEEIEEIKNTNNMGFTTEVSADWENIVRIYRAVVARVPAEIPDITLIGGHSSHSYINGTNLYFVYYYNVECGVTEEVHKYHHPINRIIMEETLRYGGSIVHHHGIGKARAAYTEAEHGSAYRLLRGLKEQFDPKGVMNAGTIFPSDLY